VARGLALAAAAIVLLAGCAPSAPTPEAGGPLLPQLSSRQRQVERLELHGAGDKTLVSLQRKDGEWQVLQRDGWRADGGRIARYLAQLAQAQRTEAKTDRPVMYPRLAVEEVSDPQAGGSELRISGRDVSARLLIGKEHKLSGGRYVRVGGQARAWLCDTDVGFDADPVSWIDHRLVEVPLARVERVRIEPHGAPAFALVSRDDRFRPDDAPSGAMRDSHAGDEIAAALEAFDIEDVAKGEAPAQVSQRLRYEIVDGPVLVVTVWREGLRDWAQLEATLDDKRAAKWAGQAGKPALEAEARARVADWSRRFAGRKFLLPPALAHTLTLDHLQILEGSATP
jgi:hypothetical protein